MNTIGRVVATILIIIVIVNVISGNIAREKLKQELIACQKEAVARGEAELIFNGDDIVFKWKPKH